MLASVLAGRLILPAHGFTAGTAPLFRWPTGRCCAPPWVSAVPGADRLLSLGAATAVRDSAAAIGVTLGLIYLFPVVAAR